MNMNTKQLGFSGCHMGHIYLEEYSSKKWSFNFQLRGLIVDKFVMMEGQYFR